MTLTQVPCVSKGTNVNLYLEQKDTNGIPTSSLTRWTNHLDAAYNAYYDLVGTKPYNGKPIDVLSYRQLYAGYWAVAGNPVEWNGNYVASQLYTVDKYDDWSFGILHELGHDYDIPNWSFNAEFWANFKMYYVVETLNGKVRVENDGTGGYIGSQLKNYYYNDASASYTKTIGNLQNRTYSTDALTYCFIRIKDRIGWEPFKNTFRDFATNNINPTTNLDKFNTFLQKLQYYYNPNGNEVESTFPAGELDFIRQSDLTT